MCRGGVAYAQGWVGSGEGSGEMQIVSRGCLQPGDRVGIGVASDELAAEQHRRGLSMPIDEIELCYLRGTEAWTKRIRISRDG